MRTNKSLTYRRGIVVEDLQKMREIVEKFKKARKV
jgi:hypothetical protein